MIARVNVRQATISDADAIVEIQVSAWRDAYRGLIPDAALDALDLSEGARIWRGALSAEHSVFVAVNGSTILGFCSLVAALEDDAVAGAIGEIRTLFIHPQYWRCGVGSALCSHAFAAALTKGYSSIVLWVLASNSRAISFYTALGFLPDGATKTEQVTSDFVAEELRMRRAVQRPD